MTDEQINADVDSIMALSEEDQAMTINLLVESLPPERQNVIREVMRAMLESN